MLLPSRISSVGSIKDELQPYLGESSEDLVPMVVSRPDLVLSSEVSSPAMADEAVPLKRSDDLWLPMGSLPVDVDDSALTVEGTHPAAVGGDFGEGMDSLMVKSGDLLVSTAPARGAARSPISGYMMDRFPLPSLSYLVGMESSSVPAMVEKDSPSASPLAALVQASVNVAHPLAAGVADEQDQGDDVGADAGLLLSFVLVSGKCASMIGDDENGIFDGNYDCAVGGVVREEGRAPPGAKEAVRLQPADGLRQPLRLPEESLPLSLGEAAVHGDAQPSRTYAHVVHSDRRADVELSFIPPDDDGNSVTMEASDGDAERWGSCLVGYFLQGSLPFGYVRSTVSRLWTKLGLTEVKSMDDGFFVFRFADSVSRDGLLEGGPWFMG
ncbi:hypothetical protein Dimus_030453, partial [Dionaea muscipula]